MIEKANGEFRLTEVGKLLAGIVVTFKQEAASVLQLAPVLEAVQNAPIDIDLTAFVGATVTSAEHGDPHSPMTRFVTLVRATDTLRGVDTDIIAPLYMDEIQRQIVEGMETEVIGLPAVTKDILTRYPDKCIEACASGHLTVWLHDDLPFGLAIFDDRVGIGVPETDTRNLRVFIDTPSTEVRKWAAAVYESYNSEAVRLDEYTHRGFRHAMEK